MLLVFVIPFRVPGNVFRHRCKPHLLYVRPLQFKSALMVNSVAVPKDRRAEDQSLLQSSIRTILNLALNTWGA